MKKPIDAGYGTMNSVGIEEAQAEYQLNTLKKTWVVFVVLLL